MRRYTLSYLLSVLFAATAPCARAVSTYTCTVVPVNVGGGELPSRFLFSTSINNKEEVAGTTDGAVSFVIDKAGVNVPYAQPTGGSVIQTSVNNLDQVAGWTGNPHAAWGSPGPEREVGFISNRDGSVVVLDPPPDTPTQSFGNIRISGINDNGDVLGQIGVTEQTGNLSQYWFIRNASGIYTLFDPQQSRIESVVDFQGSIISGPVGSINNSGTAVLGDRIRYADGSEWPISFRGSTAYLWRWYGINNTGSVVGFLLPLRYTIPFSVLLNPDGDAPAVACPDGPISQAFSVNDDGVIAGNAGSLGQPQILLATPTGFHSGVELSNMSWGFSPSPVGQQGGSGIIYLSSKGVADLQVEAITIGAQDSKDSPGDFAITENTSCVGIAHPNPFEIAELPKTLTPGESCAISFTFTPQGVGARTAQIVVYDDAPDAPHVIRLDATGLGKQKLIVSNDSWMFGASPVGQAGGSGVIYIYNPGTDAINISSIAISGGNASDFQITSNTCGATFVPYRTCAVSFQFTPAGAGVRIAGLTLTDDSPVSPQTIPLRGYGF